MATRSKREAAAKPRTRRADDAARAQRQPDQASQGIAVESKGGRLHQALQHLSEL